MAARKSAASKTVAQAPAASKRPRADQIFAVEVEPGVFVYSLPLADKLPAATRRMVDAMNAKGAERTRKAAAELRRSLASRNGAAANGSIA
jgi:hypothetical protein